MSPSFSRKYIRRTIALPGEHGAWVFIFSPLLIGLNAGGLNSGGHLSAATVYLVVAAMSAFLIRHPITIAFKALTGRRSRRDLPAARLWIVIYGLIGIMAGAGLVIQGFGYLVLLALPGVPVFAWHLSLVRNRAERGQIGLEIVGSGVLALTAPAAVWVGTGKIDPLGWWLFGLTWFQSAASIVYTYLRLEQRSLRKHPYVATRLHLGFHALLFTSFNLVFVISLVLGRVLPGLLPIPYAVQWLESIWGTLRPAIGVKPTTIGLRQLAVSTTFTILFIITWNI